MKQRSKCRMYYAHEMEFNHGTGKQKEKINKFRKSKCILVLHLQNAKCVDFPVLISNIKMDGTYVHDQPLIHVCFGTKILPYNLHINKNKSSILKVLRSLVKITD